MNAIPSKRAAELSPDEKRRLLARHLGESSRRGQFSLSFAQERLWFIDQLHPNGTVYNLPAAFRVRGALRIDVLRRAIDEIVRRHELLRTTYEAGAEGPVQVIRAHRRTELPVVDLEALAGSARAAEVTRLTREDGGRAFDLRRGPVFRVALLRQAAEDHVILYALHHIVSDGWSMGVLNREIQILYEAFFGGQPSPLPELPVQYADFAAWQRAWLTGEVLERQLAYWKRHLAGITPLQLPLDHPRRAVQTFAGGMLLLELGPELAAGLRKLGQREGATLFMVLLAGYQALLSRYSGQDDIAIGSPIANRTRPDIENLIGCFVNTLVMRTDLSGDPTVLELLRRAREVSLAAYAHQDLPFEKLVDELQPERDLSRNPLVQVELELQNVPDYGVDLKGVVLQPAEAADVTAALDLELHVQEHAQRLTAQVIYNRALFEPDTIARMAEHLKRLLAGLVRHPERHLSDIDMLSSAEREQLLVARNQTFMEHPREKCLHQLFEEQVRRTPDAVAVVHEEAQWSYETLNRRANRLAHHLRSLGVGPEVRVGICAERGLEMVMGLLGILKAGGAYVPLDPKYPLERLSFMLEDAGVAVLLVQKSVEERLPMQSALMVYLDDAGWPDGPQADANADGGVGAGNLAYMTYTSGFTGRPKGVLVSHRNAVNSTLARGHCYQAPPAATLQLLSFAFDASVGSMFGTLCRGGALVLPPGREGLPDPATIIRMAAKHKVSHLFCTPALYGTFLAQKDLTGLASLRACITGGDLCSLDLQSLHERHFPGVELFNEYGPTEATVWSTVHRTNSRPAASPRNIGRPISNVRIYVLDRSLHVVPPGGVGELYIAGEGLARGYHNWPALTAERFVPDPHSRSPGDRMYRTGDMGRYLPDAQLEFLGRTDHQVKVRGFRVELGEIETALKEYSDVTQAIVVARDGEGGDKQLAAYVVGKVDTSLSAAELKSYLASRLPEHMVPAAVVLVDQLPLTPNGKVDRNALLSLDAKRRESDYAPPRTPVEAALAEIWSKVLRRERMGIHDNFFELGGDSILSVQIVARANEAGLGLTTKDLFENQTIAQLAGITGSERKPLEETTEGGLVGLIPIQHLYFEVTEAAQVDESVFHPQLLAVRAGLEAGLVEAVIDEIVRHHDALRLRFELAEGKWRQSSAPAEAQEIFLRVNLSGLPAVGQQEALAAAAARVQQSLDLKSGPLVRAVWFDFGNDEPARLLLVIHHLAVDGVSWRILLQDLQRGCHSLEQGRAIELGDRTSSFQQWAARLQTHAASTAVKSELPYWSALGREEWGPLPFEKTGANLVEFEETVVVRLEAEETRALLQDVPEKYHTQINDVLLTALVRAMGAWTGKHRLLLDLEGHGREHLFEDLDLTRTVGWFTTIYPVGLVLDPELSAGAALRSIKEQLRAIPNRGIGYGLLRYLNAEAREMLGPMPRPEVCFNYWGQLDQVLEADSAFSRARESFGPVLSGKRRRSHVLDLGVSISGERLAMGLGYCTNLHERKTMETLADNFIRSLRELIDHCQTEGAGGFTPSDFPLAKLRQAELDRLLARLNGPQR